MAENTFTSEHWAGQLEQLELPGGLETVLRGGRDFSLLREPFAGIDDLVVVGYSSQGPAHAMNLRDAFREGGVNTRVSVALREGSPTRDRAEQDGFTVENGTLVTPEVGLARSAMALMLISDAGMAQDGKRLLSLLPKDAVVGFAHGFYLGYLQNRGEEIRSDLTVVGVCPKGMGPSVRRLFLQGAGINASAAWNEGDDRGRDLALAWSYGIGAPFTFRTTLERERLSDLVGERSILLGAVHGIVEATYQWRRNQGMPEDEAYRTSVESLVRGISDTISEKGLDGLYASLDKNQQQEFARVYAAAYPGLRDITAKIYRDVKSGREVDEVVEDGMNNAPMSTVDGSEMWQAGSKLRANDAEQLTEYKDIDVVVAALYTAGMMAQIDVLQANGHNWSEIVNESVIEAIDSLNPFMRARGVAYMIDNCSVTARRGARKWAPVFQAWLMQEVFPALGRSGGAESGDDFAVFLSHPAHQAFKTLSALRPSQPIAVE